MSLPQVVLPLSEWNRHSNNAQSGFSYLATLKPASLGPFCRNGGAYPRQKLAKGFRSYPVGCIPVLKKLTNNRINGINRMKQKNLQLIWHLKSKKSNPRLRRRVSSPDLGASTLMTSAPMSAISIVAEGPPAQPPTPPTNPGKGANSDPQMVTTQNHSCETCIVRCKVPPKDASNKNRCSLPISGVVWISSSKNMQLSHAQLD